MQPSSSATPAFSRTVLLISLSLVTLVFLTFGRVLTHEFLNWDDDIQIVNNPDLNPVTWQGYLWNFRDTRMTVYMPVSYGVWSIVALISSRDPVTQQLDPTLFHALNVVLHAGATLMVFALLKQLGVRISNAGVGAALFAVHPVQVEPVAWASGMYTVLSGVLSLASILCFVRFADACGSSRRWYALATLLYVLALLAKASSVVVPIMVALIDVLLLRKSVRRTARDMGLWLVLIVPTLLVARHFETAAHVVGTPPWTRPLLASDATATYVAKLVVPVTLLVDNGQTPTAVWGSGRLWWTWPIALGLVGVMAWSVRRRPWLTVSIGLFLVALMPFSGLAKSNFQTYSIVADRYMYLAMLGAAAGLAFGFNAGASGRIRILTGFLLVALTARSAWQVGLWRDDETLFSYNLRHNPTSLISALQLAILYDTRAEPERAEAFYNRVLQLDPRDPAIHYNVGNFYLRQDRPALAVRHYQMSIDSDPHHELAYSNLGVAQAKLGRFESAIQSFDTALRISPGLYEAHLSKGVTYELWGRPDEARQWYVAAARLRPHVDAPRQALERLANADGIPRAEQNLPVP